MYGHAKVRRRGGNVVAGAAVKIARCRVAGARDTAYETTAVSDSSGVVSFSLPWGAVVRFQSNDVPEITGIEHTVPSLVEHFLGVFFAEQATNADVVTQLASGRDNAATNSTMGCGSIPSAVAAYVTVQESFNGVSHKSVFTFAALPVTLVKNGTSTGGGGTKFYDFPEGLILPRGGSSNLTIAAAGDKSFLAAVGSSAADTGGTLSSAEISFLPSTAATTTSGAGTCKMKSTSTTPTPGSPLDGTATAIDAYLNACLNADATGVEALTFSGTVTLIWENLGDS